MQRLNENSNQFNEQALIRKYLTDTLSIDEEAILAKRYETDENFRDMLDGYEQLTIDEFDAVVAKLNAHSVSNLSEDDNLQGGKVLSIQSHPAVKAHKKRYQQLAIAACAVILLGFGFFVFMSQNTSAGKKMFAQHMEYKDYPDKITRGAGAELSSNEKMAIAAYNAENYEVSSQHFEQLTKKFPSDIKYALFLGISYLGNEQPQKAIALFESSNFKQTSFCNDINWYLGLAYLKVKEVEKAKSIFKQLSSKNCYYNDAAKEILAKI